MVQVNGQMLSVQATLKNYSVAQKRLLAVSTAQFINYLTQSSLDQDSVMSIACRITGTPFLLPWNEGFGARSASGGADLINTGRISEAVKLLKKLKGENQVQLLIELGIWYLHQSGTHKSDLDSVNTYLNAALKLSNAGKYSNWQTECQFLQAELYEQQLGDISKSKIALAQIVSTGRRDGNMEAVARAWQHLGKLLPYSDSTKLSCFKKSFGIYQQLQLTEKEIDLLWSISACHVTQNKTLAQKDFRQILSLQQATGFRHALYAENILAYTINETNYLEGLGYAKASLENMEWSGIDAVAGSFIIRVGSAYSNLGKKEDALLWFKKAMDTGTVGTHLFWYKSLFFAHTLLIEMNRPGESLSLINTVTGKYPPVTLWEKMQVLSCKGECYKYLNKPQLAGESYMALLKMNDNYPLADSYHEFSRAYLETAEFYVSQQDLKKARLLLKKASEDQSAIPYIQAEKYLVLYKIDSLEGNYKSALQNHLKYKFYYDIATSIDQRKKQDELTIKYAADKKDRDIKLLNQQKAAQQAELKQNKLIRNIMIAGAVLLLIILGLLFSQFKLKQRANKAINKKNNALQHLLTEKEWLLKEVHHRVKNNLHTVICLLESQAAYLENDALKAIENSQHRIYAMSLIHQKLYQSDDIKTIDMASYIPDLVKSLEDSFGVSNQIQFNLKIDPVHLDISHAIPLGLIINEGVTNSIKYAFPNNRKGEISISMIDEGGWIKLELADDGIGMPEIEAVAESGSLGIVLMKGLSEDIDANIDFEIENGTKITIKFKPDAINDPQNIVKSSNAKDMYV